jgi:hypothetical protein
MKPTQATLRTSIPHFIGKLLTGAFFIASINTNAGVVVNGAGFGNSRVSGWSGITPPPAAAYTNITSAGFLPNATLNVRGNPAAYSATGPDPNALQSVNTFAFAAGAPLWNITMGGTPYAGDDIAGSNPALFNLVTPTLYSANVDLTLNAGTIENLTTILFTGTFEGDAGTAASLSFSDIFSSGSPTPLDILDPTGPGTLQTDGSLLFLGSGSGNPTQSFSFTITDSAALSNSGTNSNYLQNYVQADGEFVATSVPEPSSIGLLVVGVLALACRRRN